MTSEELQKVREWAHDKVTQGGDPPWAWYQYMKLREALDAIINGMNCTEVVTVPEELPQAGQRRGSGHLRLVNSDPQDNDQQRLDAVEVQLPM